MKFKNLNQAPCGIHGAHVTDGAFDTPKNPILCQIRAAKCAFQHEELESGRLLRTGVALCC